MSWESVLLFDLQTELRGVLLRLRPGLPTDSLHLGKVEGGIFSFDHTSVAGVIDGVVSGPPCPPFSSIGLGGSEEDVRSRVYLRVLDWVIHFATTLPARNGGSRCGGL